MKQLKSTVPIKRGRGLPKSQYKDHSVKSPCTAICKLDETDSYCIGCYRTVDELRDWCIMDADQKSQVLEEIELRKTK